MSDTERKIYSSKYVRIWYTFDTFGLSVVYGYDSGMIVLRIGAIVFVFGKGRNEK